MSTGLVIPLGITPIIAFDNFESIIAADISLTDICTEFLDFSDIPFRVKFAELSNLIFLTQDGDASLNQSATFDVVTHFDDSGNQVSSRLRTLAIESTRATIGKSLFNSISDNLDIFDLANDLSGDNLYPDASDALTQVFNALNNSGAYSALVLAGNEVLDTCESRLVDASSLGIFRTGDRLIFNTFVHNGEITINLGTGVDGNQSDISFFVAQSLGITTSFPGGRANQELDPAWVDGDANAGTYPTYYNVYTLDRSAGPYLYPNEGGNPEFILRGTGNSAERAGGVLVRMAVQVYDTLPT
jgi:hypothetical protein